MRPASTIIALAALALLPAPGPGPAQDAAGGRDGLFITVPNPLGSKDVDLIRQKVQDAIERKKRNITTVVFDFNPGGAPSGTSDFGPCNSLAKFIRQLQLGQIKPGWPRISTVAFVHAETTKHTVLPVLACDQVIMSDELDSERRPAARLGGVTRGLDGVLDEVERTAYRGIAKQYPSPDVIQRMSDPELPLRKVRTKQGERYLSAESIKEWEGKGQLVGVDAGTPQGLQPGQSIFEPELARELKIAKEIYRSRAELAAALQLPRQSLTEDWLVGRGTPVVWWVELRGPLDAGKLKSLERRIKAAVARDANFIILHLDSEGGETRDAATMANWLRRLTDQSGVLPVKTVAFIPPRRSIGAATFLALGCSEIVMSKDAALADFGYLQGDEFAEARSRAAEMLAPLAKEQGYPPLLFRAALDPNLVLVRVKPKDGGRDEMLVTEKEFEEDQRAMNPRWNSLGRLFAKDAKSLKITADLAREWRIAMATDIETLEGLYQYYGVEPQRVRAARDDWLDHIAEFFREPWVRFVLIMLGIIGLILELKMPGATLPGVVSAVCFVLFFWAYSFVGEFTLLAVLLFILGLVLIAVEIFLIPGFGVPGISGLLLVVISMVLVTLEKMPETTQDWVALGSTLTMFGLSMAAAVVGAFTLAWYLPSIPYANRLILRPPEEETAGLDEAAQVPAYAGLLGAVGVAATTLRPAGKAQFGEDFLDVVAEGDYVNAGSRVQIIEIEGNRIVVKEI
jgi:membrane-bound ClpP family serine protease